MPALTSGAEDGAVSVQDNVGMPDAALPTRDRNHEIGAHGVLAAKTAVVKDLKWIFREQVEDDYGIDAHLEVVGTNNLPVGVTGQLIGAQIKGGQTQKRPAKGRDGWYYYSRRLGTLNYWLGHSLPVIVTVYDQPTDTCYWQVVRNDLVERTKKGFKIFVPRTQSLNAASRGALEDVARRTGQHALEAYERSLSLLPHSVATELRRADQADPAGAARVAQILADGRAQPGMTAAHLLGAQPTWMANSEMAAALWAAVAGYANAHLEYTLAAQALVASSRCGGPLAGRRRAMAGLAYYLANNREQARVHLDAVTADNARLLADMGLAALAVPERDARAIPVPASIANASQEVLDAEPVVLNFLAENASRRGDSESAVGLMQRALTASGGNDSQTRLRLAEMLRRHMQARGGFGGSNSAAARRHARAALDDMRRWGGPSHAALSELLDMEILDGTLRGVIGLALPVAAGGSALDREAADADIARKGAAAAQMRPDAHALASFRRILNGDPWLAILDAQGTDLEPMPAVDRKKAWRRALKAADDDRYRSVCASRLAELGVWPIAEAEDMVGRSVMPSWIYKILQAKAEAVIGRADDAVRQLRILAEDNATAALELIRLLDRLGDPAAAQEWELQYRRWNDSMLVDLMLYLSVPGTGSEQLWLRFLGDSRLSNDTRASLRLRLVRSAADRQDWSAVVELCQAGLASFDPSLGEPVEAEDTDLAWQLAAAYFNLHDMRQARVTLDRYRLACTNEDTARLWVRLRLGTDLTATDAEFAASLAERYGRAIAEPVSTMLLRERHRHHRDGNPPWPQALLDRIQEIIDVAQAQGYGPESISYTELLRRLEQTDRQELDRSCRDAQAGRLPLARFAAHAGRPYGQVLLQQAIGLIVAVDPEPSLNAIGQDTARRAMDAGLVVADLSSLYLLHLLGDHGRDLRSRLPQMIIAESTKIDIIACRDAIWAVTGASFTAGLDGDRLVKHALTGADRARLRTLSAELEDLAAHLGHDAVGVGSMPAFDSIALAATRGAALYADDVALRQAARGQGVPAFGTCDIIAAVNQPATDQMYLLLGRHGVVDLPLTADQIIELERDANWSNGPGALALSRRQWWQRRPDVWSNEWMSVAEAAARHSPNALTTISKAALSGSLQHSSAGQATQRYQQIVVVALEAVYAVGATPPLGFLDDLASLAVGNVTPQLKYVYHALRAALQQRGVADAIAAAATLMPEVEVADPALWI
jgi:hypothetical protein